MLVPRVVRVRLARIPECGVASLARELGQQLIAIHELAALDALDAPGEFGLLLRGQFEPLVIFLGQDRYGRALLQALAFDLDPAGDDLAGDQLHRFTSRRSVPRPTCPCTRYWLHLRGAVSPVFLPRQGRFRSNTVKARHLGFDGRTPRSKSDKRIRRAPSRVW